MEAANLSIPLCRIILGNRAMYPTCMILQVLLVVQRHAASSTRYDLACPQVPQMPASEMLRDIAGRMEFVSEVFEGPVILLEMTGFPEEAMLSRHRESTYRTYRRHP